MKKNKKLYKKKEWDLLVKYYQICFNSPKKIFFDLKECLKLDCIWIIACKNILKNKIFSGILSLVLKPAILLHLKKQVLLGQFKWTNCFKIKLKTFNLQLFIEFCNQLVQEVLRLVIEPIFDTRFESTSFGFRFNMKTDVVLHYLLNQMHGTKWVIQGDLKGFFATVNISRLMILVGKRIKDPIILNLLNIGLSLKIFNSNYDCQPVFGIPLGGILSPLLANIYLDSLDKEIKVLSLKFLGVELNFNDSKINFIQQNCFKYLRFGADFLIAINSSYQFAVKLKEVIIQYIQSQLNILFFDDRFKLISFLKGITFLGFIWQQSRQVNVNQKNISCLKNTSGFLKIDLKLVLISLSYLKFCDGNGKSLPLFKYLHLSQYETNCKVNKLLRYLCNKWSFAINRKYITSFATLIIKFSLAKMYAAKFKLKTTAAVFKKGGVLLNKAIGKEKKSAIGLLKKDNILIPKILYISYQQIPKRENPSFFSYKNNIFLEFVKTGTIFSLLKLLKHNREFIFFNNLK